MPDTTYSLKPGREDRVFAHTPKLVMEHKAESETESRPGCGVAQSACESAMDPWEGDLETDVTKMHESVATKLRQSETKLKALSDKIEELRRRASESPAAKGA